ncbi:dnaJ homolog dnj-5 [Euwallacea similis]|uniref:dnaJ homolog dnj-5 n=1 Tax=Euwallacea similis TaxID=1736056 RepID=UPI00344B7C58
MSEATRGASPNDTRDKIIRDMTSDVRNNQGQYMPLGFPSQQNVAHPIGWSAPAASSPFLNYGLHYQEAPLNQAYLHQGNLMFESGMFQKNMNPPEYNGYPNIRPNSVPQTLYNNYPQTVITDNIIHDPLVQNSTHSQVFDNLVGNWSLPNNTGTYSPFGNTDTFKPTSLFEFQAQNVEIPEKENKFKQADFVADKFNFNNDFKKTRPLAEVKPMRPSYSDVLTKPVPATSNIKPIKSEVKDVKVKNKDSRKNGKIDKTVKVSNTLNRSNTNNDIKDLPIDKPFSTSKPERKPIKASQLNRKWNSLDNIAEPSVKIEEPKRVKKPEEVYSTKPLNKVKNKANKNLNNFSDEVSDDAGKNESASVIKNLSKKTKSSVRPKQNDNSGTFSERPSSKRNQKARRRDNHHIVEVLVEKAKLYVKGWWKMFTVLTLWLVHLISDVCSLSIHLGHDFALNSWTQLKFFWKSFTITSETVLKRFRVTAWIWNKFEQNFKNKDSKSKFEEETNSFLNNGLDTNISMPTTGDEAMKRLLACKGKDPYSILGVTPKCSDDDIKKYYKRQAFLVHPDKNNQPGAEEAFKILVHAFDMIGTPERRAIYDRGVAESAFVVQNFSQMAELLQQLQQKMEMNANTIRCSACGDRHKRIKMDRPSYAARNCKTCKIHHAAREGDIWAEARCFGFLWHYYACMEGSVYDISDWASCQKETLKHLKPDTHQVQYRIALGKQNSSQPRRSSQTARMDKPDLENLLNSLYGHESGGSSRRKNKNRK